MKSIKEAAEEYVENKMGNEREFIQRIEHEIRQLMGGMGGVEITLESIKNNSVATIAKERIEELRVFYRKIADELNTRANHVLNQPSGDDEAEFEKWDNDEPNDDLIARAFNIARGAKDTADRCMKLCDFWKQEAWLSCTKIKNVEIARLKEELELAKNQEYHPLTNCWRIKCGEYMSKTQELEKKLAAISKNRDEVIEVLDAMNKELAIAVEALEFYAHSLGSEWIERYGDIGGAKARTALKQIKGESQDSTSGKV